MNHLPNIGLYLSNTSDKNLILRKIIENKFLCEHINLSPLQGVLYSSITIDRMIDEELRHDHILIRTNENETLQTMSSGQQKKALLSYLIAQKPQYMVLDDVYSNVDKATQISITRTLSELAETTLLIQLFFRKHDLLPCIEKVLSVNGDNEIIKDEDASSFRSAQSQDINPHLFRLPQGYTENHADTDPLIELRAVSVHYAEKQVLNKVKWTIRKGEFWQLTGPNGAGKSTLISMITGDNPKAYGQDMMLFGRKKGSGESIWDIKRQIGYFTPAMIHQFTRVDTVENMIISGLNDSVGLYIEPSDLQRDIARGWLDMLGDSFRNKTFQNLSLGQQRMVMVARAMVKHPPLLILDEPTIELDDANSRLFIDMVKAFASEKQIAIIYVSHRDEEDLQPDKIFELVKAQNGYTGTVRK
ncbi:MAG: ATP-binding cassette domain-containing protein [Bacteroidales bacterium]|nr:ATP-binding cassette domain-containing protein [Bacteroidales bacterium]